MSAGREEFMARLTREFPDVVAGIDSCSSGLLHCEVAAFRRATEKAMDTGHLWAAERHFRLVQELLAVAGSELENALEVSYLEDLALGEWTSERYRAIRERMPKALRETLIGHLERWR
jgi:hypothetical protein